MSKYATLAQLQNMGIARLFLNKATPAQQEAELVAASDIADYHIAARYTLPLLQWPASLTEAVCKVAVYKLMVFVGYNPDAEQDSLIRRDYEDAMKFFLLIQKQQAHPLFVDSSPGGNSAAQLQPQVVTSSMVYMSTGQQCRNRGW